MWLGDQRARAMLHAQPDNWLIRPAGDGRAPATMLSSLAADQRAELLARIEAQPWAYAASAAIAPSVAPSVGPQEGSGEEGGSAVMVPRQIMLRLFLTFDGTEWRAMQGGLARVLQDSDRLAGTLPASGLSKDVWVLNDDRNRYRGAAGGAAGARWRSAAPPATCPAASRMTCSGSAATSNAWKPPPAWCAPPSTA